MKVTVTAYKKSNITYTVMRCFYSFIQWIQLSNPYEEPKQSTLTTLKHRFEIHFTFSVIQTFPSDVVFPSLPSRSTD